MVRSLLNKSGSAYSGMTALGLYALMGIGYMAHRMPGPLFKEDGEGGGGGSGGGKGKDDKGDDSADDDADKGADDSADDDADKGDDDKGADDKAGKGKKAAAVPKGQYDKLHKELMSLKGKNRELKTLIAQAPSKDQIKEYAKWKDEKAAKEKEIKKAQGRYEELLSEQTKKHEEEKSTYESKLAKSQGKYVSTRVNQELGSLIPQHTGVPVKDVINALFRDNITLVIDEESEEETFELKDENGEHPKNPKTGQDMTLAEFVEAEIAKKPWLIAVKPSGGSGGRSQTDSKLKKGELSEEDIANMPMAEFRKKRDAIIAGVGPAKK